MEKKKLLFIYNPKAGKAQIKNQLFEIVNVFVKAGYLVTVYPTQCSGDAINFTMENSKHYDLLVCSGGDGTLDEIVTGMMRCETRIPIGYIPAGSTNDFANSLHIPKNMLHAAEVAVNGDLFPCDIGAINEDDSFVYIAAFGLFTDVSYETNQQVKNVLGHMAYIMEGMKRLSTIESYQMKVFHDDVLIEGDFLFGMVTNSISVGGFKRITGKYVELDDGVFEVTLIKRPANAAELNSIMAALVMRDIDADCMYCFKTNSIRFESEQKIAWTLDGEFGGMHHDVFINNCKHAVEIKVPVR